MFFLLFGQLSAQDYTVNVQQFGLEEGLADRSVDLVFKDESGFLWLISKNILQRYDGYEFKTFHLPMQITEIRSCGNGVLALYGAFNLDILFFDIYTGKITNKGERWGEAAALQYDSLSAKYGEKAYLSKEQKRLFIWNATKITAVDISTGQQQLIAAKSLLDQIGEPVLRIIEYQNKIWIATKSELLLIDAQQNILNSVQKLPNVNDFTMFYLNEPNNEVCYLNRANTSKQLRLYQLNENGTSQFVFEEPIGFEFRELIAGQIWCIGDLGWRVFDVSGKILFDLKRTDYDKMLFEGTILNKIVKDDAGKFYLPTQFGLNIIEVKENPFTQYFSKNKEKPLPIANSARNIHVENDSIIAIFEFGGIVFLHKNNPKDYNILLSESLWPADNTIVRYSGRTILRDSEKRFWAGEIRALSKWSPNFSAQEQIDYVEETYAQYEQAWSLFEDKNNCIWIGCSEALRKLCPEETKLTVFNYLKSGFGIDHLTNYQIQEPQDGFLWLCTDKGLFTFDKETKKVIAHYHKNGKEDHQIPADEIHYMYIDSHGNRWLGTRAGLIFWNTQTNEKRLFTRKDGLSNNVIYAVFEDEYERLWLSSDYGIMSFDKNTFDVQAYLPKDGVAQEEFNRISHFQEPDGTIYFGGLNGITAFHPKDFIQKEKDYEQLMITDFEIFDGKKGELIN